MAANPYDQFDEAAQSVPLPISSANPYDQFDPPDTKTAAPVASSQPSGALHTLGLGARNIMTGLGSLPLMAMDAGVGLRNMWDAAPSPTNQMIPNPKGGMMPDPNFHPESRDRTQYQMPSQMWENSMDSMLPSPANKNERLASALQQMAAGAAIPAPKIGNVSPSFVSPAETQGNQMRQLVSNSQKAGYVVPPATAQPSTLASVMETIAGKQKVAQGASLRNQQVTNTLAKKSLGLNPDAPLTPESLSALRSEAGQSYQAIKKTGSVTSDPQFQAELNGVLSKYQGAGQSFPELAKTDLQPLVDAVNKPTFDAGAAVDATRILRDKADAAFGSGDKGTGQGIKAISNAIESQLDRHLQSLGPQYQDTLNDFRNARQTIAKTYTIQDALNPASGNVNAAKLANALKKNAPLQGDMKTAAQFATAFPKAAQEPTHSMGVNHLDSAFPAIGGMIGEMSGGHPLVGAAAGIGVPMARKAAQLYALGPMQKGLGMPSTGPTSELAKQLLKKLPMGSLPLINGTQSGQQQ